MHKIRATNEMNKLNELLYGMEQCREEKGCPPAQKPDGIEQSNIQGPGI